jgi:trigger factor
MERLPESRVQLEITAEEAESADALRRAERKVGNQVTLPGFRKGKAPRFMIEQVYGPEVFQEEAHRYLMTDLYRQALEQTDITPVGDPEVDIASTEPLTFTVVVPVFPDIDPGPYRTVRVEPVDASIEESAVDALLEDLRKIHSPWVDPQSEGLQVGAGLELTPKTRYPREGDQVTIDYTIQAEGEPLDEPVVDAVFVLGESGLLEAIEDAIKGLRVGEATGFSVAFAEDDESVDAELRGKSLSYTVALKGLKERDLVPLDDDFAKTAGDADTLEELRQTLRANLHHQRTEEAYGEAMDQILTRIEEGAVVELPATMIERSLESHLTRMRGRLASSGLSLEAYLRATEQTEDDLRDELRPGIATTLRRQLLLRKIAEEEKIEVDEAEIDAAVERLSANLREREVAQPKQSEQFARSDYVRDTLYSSLYERQLTDRLIEIATGGQSLVVNAWTPPPAAEVTELAEPEGPATELTGDAAGSKATVADGPGAGIKAGASMEATAGADTAELVEAESVAAPRE